VIARVAGRVAWLVGVVGIYLAGWGWLEYLRHVALGPTVADALPLYENARADRVSLAAVFVVWYVTALAALLPWRPRRPLVAGTIAMALVLVGLGLVIGVQLTLVRASVLGEDFGAAMHTELPWIASLATAAAAGTLWHRRPPDVAVVVAHDTQERELDAGDTAPRDDADACETSAGADAPIHQIPV